MSMDNALNAGVRMSRQRAKCCAQTVTMLCYCWTWFAICMLPEPTMRKCIIPPCFDTVELQRRSRISAMDKELTLTLGSQSPGGGRASSGGKPPASSSAGPPPGLGGGSALAVLPPGTGLAPGAAST